MPDEVREFALLCPHCGEENPPEFPACWSCHGDLPASADADPAPSAPVKPALDPTARAGRRKRLAFELAVVLSILWLPYMFGVLVYDAQGGWIPLDPRDQVWAFVQGFTYLSLLVYFVWLDGDWRRELGLLRPRVFREIAFGVGVWTLMLFANFVGLRVAGALGHASEPRIEIDYAGNALWIVPLDLLVWALVEEIFFRAYLCNRFTELTGRPGWSIALSALLFSASHGYPLSHSFALFLGGIVLGWIFRLRRSLWALVLGHWLYNLF